jgi:hypothetical protein
MKKKFEQLFNGLFLMAMFLAALFIGAIFSTIYKIISIIFKLN